MGEARTCPYPDTGVRVNSPMTAKQTTTMVPVGGVVAVLRDRKYQLIDHTGKSWVFRSKNPDAYGFALPATRTLVPVEMVRRALRDEPLDAREVVAQAIRKPETGEAQQYQDYDDGDAPLVIDVDEAIRTLAEAPNPQVKRTPEELERMREAMKQFQSMVKECEEQPRSVGPDDYGLTDGSQNLKEYIYTPEQYLRD